MVSGRAGRGGVRLLRLVVGATVVLVSASGSEAASPHDEMKLTFSEDFKSFEAGPNGLPRWKSTLPHGNRTLPHNHEAEFYVDRTLGVDPFRISGGHLVISAARGDGALQFRSGLISTEHSFSQLHGYFEMRARLPAGRGLWPAFWLLPAGGGWPPEIDVMEMLGQDTKKMYVSVHARFGGRSADVTSPIATPDLSANFHVFAVDWRAEGIAWYVDDRLVKSMPVPAGMTVPMFLVINLAVGGAGSWPGTPDASTVFPARMEVDYVRVYQ